MGKVSFIEGFQSEFSEYLQHIDQTTPVSLVLVMQIHTPHYEKSPPLTPLEYKPTTVLLTYRTLQFTQLCKTGSLILTDTIHEDYLSGAV